MKPMKEALEAADRTRLIADTVSLIDSEVQRKRGVSGFAIRNGYKVVKKLKNGRMIEKAVNMLLDDFTGAIAPLHDTYREAGASGSFATYLQQHDDEAANALLAITDDKATRAESKVIKKTYNALRPQAVGHVKEALPGLGRMIDQYTRD